MGFPINYTLPCVPKKRLRGTTEHLGPTSQPHWQYMECTSGPAGSFLGQLCGPLGLCPRYTPQDIVNFFGSRATGFLADPAVAGAAAASAR